MDASQYERYSPSVADLRAKDADIKRPLATARKRLAVSKPQGMWASYVSSKPFNNAFAKLKS